jgi:hypothetical protein
MSCPEGRSAPQMAVFCLSASEVIRPANPTQKSFCGPNSLTTDRSET